MFKLVDYIEKSFKEFVALAFWFLFFILLAIYLRYYRNIGDLTIFLVKFIGPLAILTYGAALATSKNLRKTRKSKKAGEGMGEFAVVLNYMDLLRHELTAFVVALVILVTPYFFREEYSWIYVFSAFFAFIAIWWLKMFYFKE